MTNRKNGRRWRRRVELNAGTRRRRRPRPRRSCFDRPFALEATLSSARTPAEIIPTIRR